MYETRKHRLDSSSFGSSLSKDTQFELHIVPLTHQVVPLTFAGIEFQQVSHRSDTLFVLTDHHRTQMCFLL